MVNEGFDITAIQAMMFVMLKEAFSQQKQVTMDEVKSMLPANPKPDKTFLSFSTTAIIVDLINNTSSTPSMQNTAIPEP
ncbi:conserved hypothetical protein [Ricinus communis]|uniref:Uncharacterized protein n=1 Tax=Ricinus communis TaxID=3988 RepID=B9RRK8_RICCO|nr:conserved hypothetical protein [Ricinus communis]